MDCIFIKYFNLNCLLFDSRIGPWLTSERVKQDDRNEFGLLVSLNIEIFPVFEVFLIIYNTKIYKNQMRLFNFNLLKVSNDKRLLP